ncbi:MAG: cbb3-type cytochrome c oxidase subunit II [Spirosomataceae bacterium]
MPREYSKAGEFVYDHPFQWGSKHWTRFTSFGWQVD